MEINRIPSQENNMQQMLNQNTKVSHLNSERDNNGRVGLKNGSINVSQLNLRQDNIANRKDFAQKQAMGVILKKFASDQKIDNLISASQDNIGKNKQHAMEMNQVIVKYIQQRDELREGYEVEKDSEEEKKLEIYSRYKESLIKDSTVKVTDEEKETAEDMELYVRYLESQKHGTDIVLSEKEEERLTNIVPLTEYQLRAIEMEDLKSEKMNELKALTDLTKLVDGIVGSIYFERLKDLGMEHAFKLKDTIETGANKEIMGMLVDEGLEKLKQDQEEAVEEVKKSADAKKETEEIEEDSNEAEEEAERKTEIEKEVLSDRVRETNDLFESMSRAADEAMASKVNIPNFIQEAIKGIALDSYL
jgi:hypothetical protein